MGPIIKSTDNALDATPTIQRQAFDEDQIGMDMGPAFAAGAGGDLAASAALAAEAMAEDSWARYQTLPRQPQELSRRKSCRPGKDC